MFALTSAKSTAFRTPRKKIIITAPRYSEACNTFAANEVVTRWVHKWLGAQLQREALTWSHKLKIFKNMFACTYVYCIPVCMYVLMCEYLWAWFVPGKLSDFEACLTAVVCLLINAWLTWSQTTGLTECMNSMKCL